jgi:hypothetical protein
MNPPCTGDETTCGKKFDRAVACYQVPANFTFGANWTTAPGVKSINTSYCPDVAGTPAYDVTTGLPVPRGSDGKLVVSTVCPSCNFVTGVQPWVVNSCPCVQPGDYCNLSQGTGPNGVCHSDGTTPCTSAECPTSFSLNDWPKWPLRPASSIMQPFNIAPRSSNGLRSDKAIVRSNGDNNVQVGVKRIMKQGCVIDDGCLDKLEALTGSYAFPSYFHSTWY